MKITKSQLRQIIKEELELNEAYMHGGTPDAREIVNTYINDLMRIVELADREDFQYQPGEKEGAIGQLQALADIIKERL